MDTTEVTRDPLRRTDSASVGFIEARELVDLWLKTVSIMSGF